MYKLAIFLFLFLFILSCKQNEKPDCLRYRDGTFRVKAKPGNNSFTITRDRENQTELDLQTDTLSGSKVKWINECEYELIPVYKRPHYSDTNERRAIIQKGPLIPLRVRIVATGGDYYIFEAQKEGIDFLYSDTLWVLKK